MVSFSGSDVSSSGAFSVLIPFRWTRMEQTVELFLTGQQSIQTKYWHIYFWRRTIPLRRAMHLDKYGEWPYQGSIIDVPSYILYLGLVIPSYLKLFSTSPWIITTAYIRRQLFPFGEAAFCISTFSTDWDVGFEPKWLLCGLLRQKKKVPYFFCTNSEAIWVTYIYISISVHQCARDGMWQMWQSVLPGLA